MVGCGAEVACGGLRCEKFLQVWRSVPSAPLYPQLRCTPIFRDLGTEETREGFIFWRCVSSPTHQGHIFMYKRHTKVHFAWYSRFPLKWPNGRYIIMTSRKKHIFSLQTSRPSSIFERLGHFVLVSFMVPYFSHMRSTALSSLKTDNSDDWSQRKKNISHINEAKHVTGMSLFM